MFLGKVWRASYLQRYMAEFTNALVYGLVTLWMGYPSSGFGQILCGFGKLKTINSVLKAKPPWSP